MRKRKHTNDCLLRLLNLGASVSFVLLIGLFAVYFLTERPEVYTEEQLATLTENLTGKRMNQEVISDQIATQDDVNEPQFKNEQEVSIEQTTDQPSTPSDIQQDTKASMTQDTMSEAKAESHSNNLVEESPSGESTAQADLSNQTGEVEFKEVPIYDAYVLMLDDELVGQMEGVYNNGRIDYQNVVNKMFSNLSFSEQLKLLNIILSKVQNININEVWNMIKDGIDEEDSKKLQEIVQANFTLEELDELYMYYQSMEMVQNE